MLLRSVRGSHVALSAISRMCGNECQPGLPEIVEKLSASLRMIRVD